MDMDDKKISEELKWFYDGENGITARMPHSVAENVSEAMQFVNVFRRVAE